jgi:hypothetical protein
MEGVIRSRPTIRRAEFSAPSATSELLERRLGVRNVDLHFAEF